MRLFVNRLAYGIQRDKPLPDGTVPYIKQARPLDLGAVRMHLNGDMTINLYAINPQTQSSKWVAIDADYACIGGVQDRGGIAAGPERAIDISAAIMRREMFNHLAQQHRNVPGRRERRWWGIGTPGHFNAPAARRNAASVNERPMISRPVSRLI